MKIHQAVRLHPDHCSGYKLHLDKSKRGESEPSRAQWFTTRDQSRGQGYEFMPSGLRHQELTH